MANHISMMDGSGNIVKEILAIFPIIKETDPEHWEIIGTGFYITANGIVATARHVLADVIDENKKKQKHAIFLAHFYEKNKFLIRPIVKAILSNEADVALGLPAEFKNDETGELLRSKVLTLTTEIAKTGDRLATFAYPKSYTKQKEIHCWPDYYEGTVTEYYPNGHILLKEACYQTSINILPGASGGPVFSPDGHVIGINSAGFNGQPDISHVSCISSLLKLSIPVNGRNCTISDLSNMGYVSLVKQ